ncbi:hypothetical protein [Streptomyces flavidovirens]|uniref:hypothetical protein n=1 Tax=Streptomyces flavidovirens TaxID=67298 RepID=UPI0036CBB5A7
MTDQPIEHCGELPPGLGLNGAIPSGECVLRPGHSGSHATDTGMRWWRTTPNNPATGGDAADNCCACGKGPVVYRNYREQPFCGHCANCACGANPCSKPATTDDLRDQYAAAIYERNNPTRRWADAHPDDLLAYAGDADAILAVRDTRVEELTARAEQAERRLDLAHQARRAKEHQLDGIRRALCDTGAMRDDDPYSHADLEDVIRQAAAADLKPALSDPQEQP